MRIAISGTACQGKTTLINDFLQEWSSYKTPDKSYRDLLTDDHSTDTNEDTQWDVLNFMVDQLQETTQFIRSKSPIKPRVGIVLGSGLGGLVDRVQMECEIPYDEIPHFSTPSVEGHKGRLIIGHLCGVPIALLQGSSRTGAQPRPKARTYRVRR